MNKTIALAAFAAVAAGANASLILTAPNSAVGEDFDGLGSTTVAGMFSATVGVQSAITGSTFDGTRIAGTTTAATDLTANDGSANAGGMYSDGAVGSAERALGLLASGSRIMAFGVEIVNNTGVALDSITLRFHQENWRSSTSTSGTPNTMTFAWGVNSTSATYLTDAGLTNDATFNLVGPTPVATNGALDGNLAANQVNFFGNITFATPLANGQSVFLRWSDVDDQGSDANIAIDDFNVVGNPVPEPATLAVLGLVAAAAARRKRK